MNDLNETQFWITKSGDKIRIKDLNSDHLVKIINIMKRNGADVIRNGSVNGNDIAYDEDDSPLFLALNEEANFRGLTIKGDIS